MKTIKLPNNSTIEYVRVRSFFIMKVKLNISPVLKITDSKIAINYKILNEVGKFDLEIYPHTYEWYT